MAKYKTTQGPPHHARGFTLIETFLALTILILALVGPMTLASQGLAAAAAAKEQVIASFLAQDAIEFVRSRRDNDTAAGREWLFSVGCRYNPGNGESPTWCTVNSIDPEGMTVVFGGDQSSALANVDNMLLHETGFYNHNTGTESIYTRIVTVEEVVAGQEAIIHVAVGWTSDGRQRVIEAAENIFNWQ